IDVRALNHEVHETRESPQDHEERTQQQLFFAILSGALPSRSSRLRFYCGAGLFAFAPLPSRFAAPPKIRRPSAVVIVACPTFIDSGFLARTPWTLTVSPIFSVSLRHPWRKREFGGPPSTLYTIVLPFSFVSTCV